MAIYETGECEGQHFFSMEYVQGRNLAEIARDGPLPAQRAARYAQVVADAIHSAHQQGTLHRDLKPSNVLIDADDQPRITDFGLAKRVRGDFGLTVAGQVLGSPNFMPPEQTGAKQSKVGPTSDVYGVGAILYHLLTGRPPFQAEAIEDVLIQLRETEPIAPRLLNPSVPRDLETICLKCLEKEPAKRYPTAEALAQELGRFLRDEPILARPATRWERGWRWCRRKPVVASLAAAVVLVFGLGFSGVTWQWHRAEQERRRVQEGAVVLRQHLYAADMNLAQHALEENNLGLAVELLDKYRPANPVDPTLNDQSTTDLRGWEWRYLWRLARSEELFTLGNHLSGVTSLTVSPDGTIMAASSTSVKLWEIESRREIATLLENGAAVGSLALSPDGATLAAGVRNEGIRLWDVATKRVIGSFPARQEPPPNATSWSAHGLAFAPDNRTLAVGDFDGTVALWDNPTKAKLATLKGHRGLIASLGFSPDGQTLASASWDGTVRLWNTGTGDALASLTNHAGQVHAVAWSRNGNVLASASADKTIKLWDSASWQEIVTLTNHTAVVHCLAFSPDGKTLASGSWDQTIRLWDIDTRRETRVFRGNADEVFALAFSPDGSTLGSGCKDAKGEIELAQMGRCGSGSSWPWFSSKSSLKVFLPSSPS